MNITMVKKVLLHINITMVTSKNEQKLGVYIQDYNFAMFTWYNWFAVADLRGVRGTLPDDPNSFNFMQFLGNLAKSYVGAPSSGESWIRH